MKYMPERKRICTLGLKMWEMGWVAANDGNISVQCDKDRYLITPAGVSKGELTPDMILLIDGDGEKLDEGSPWEPSSETALHLMCYKSRPGVGGVCHSHAPFATAYACCRKEIDAAILGEAVMTHGSVPCAPYAPTGSKELPRAVEPYIMGGHDAVLMANHGLVTVGRRVEDAFATMERVEHTARISLYAAQLGGGVPLTTGEQAELKK